MKKTITAFGTAVLMAGSAIADPPAASLTASGYAPQVCTVGSWSKVSGSGTLTGDTQAVVTYNESDLVDANSMAVLNSSKAFTLHIPVLCNTAMSWGIEGAKGAFRNDTVPAPLPGFANEWLYHLDIGPKKVGGGLVGYFPVQFDSDGTPFSGITFNLNQTLAQTVAYFSLDFTPLSATQRMLAGHYSEVLTLTISPGL
jgi:hypothetical protein